MTPVRAVVCAAALLAAAGHAVAARLPADAAPLHYQLVVTPDFATATFDGDLTIDIRVLKATSRITLNAVGLDVLWAEITPPGGRPQFPVVTADPAAETAVFTLPARILPGTIKLHVRYSGKLRSDGRGFYLARAYGRKYALSRMEATGARCAFPSFDEPGFTASFAVSAVIDHGLLAISNGKTLSDTPGPHFGKHTVRFGTTPRMSPYLVALAIGRFECEGRDADGTPLRACVVPEQGGRARGALDLLEHAFRAESRYFTLRYPFGKLDLVARPDGAGDAMGVPGAIVCDEAALPAPGAAPGARTAAALDIARGVARQWLGGVVSVAWWDDLWLVEGLAAWAAPKALAAWRPLEPTDAWGATETRAAMCADALRSGRPLRSPASTGVEIEESFDAGARTKAAEVFGMMEAWLGADVFRDALNAFVRAGAYQPAAGEDFWNRLATVSGQPADRVLLCWVARPGVPVLAVDTACEGGETVVTVEQRRFGADSAGTPLGAGPWQVPLGIRGVGVDSPLSVFTNRLLTEPRQAFRMPGCFPGVIVNARAAGYFRTLLTPEARARLTPLALTRMTPTERLRFLDDSWTFAGTGAVGIGDHMALVKSLAADPTPDVLEAVAEELVTVGDDLAAGPARDRFGAWVAGAFGPAAAGLGWRVAPGESIDRQRIRAALFDILGRAARDLDTLAAARALAVAHLSGGPALHPSLVPVATRLAARSGDAALLDRLRALDELEVLAHAQDPAFITRTLGAALDAPDEPGRMTRRLSAALGNPAVNVQVWQFLRSRWADLQPKLAGPFAVASVVAAAGAFCDGAMRDEVGRFFADKPSAPPRTVRLALDRIDGCRDRRVRVDASMREWLDRGTEGAPDRGSEDPRYKPEPWALSPEPFLPDTAGHPTTKQRH